MQVRRVVVFPEERTPMQAVYNPLILLNAIDAPELANYQLRRFKKENTSASSTILTHFCSPRLTEFDLYLFAEWKPSPHLREAHPTE